MKITEFFKKRDIILNKIVTKKLIKEKLEIKIIKKVKKEKNFLIKSKKLFITFSSCNIPIDKILREKNLKIFGISGI